MAYKGTDLDLRAPRAAALAWETPAFTPGPASSERVANGAGMQAASVGAGPIAVDDTLLACCNTAFDVARFHASPDVRLEHLLHALTRVGAAADVLAELGIRVDTLRRDTAVAIAADIPAAAIESDGMPRASAAFEDVLRRAADQAARRRVPAGLHDLLRTILGGGPASPASTLLMRAAADPQRLERWRDAPLRAALIAPVADVKADAASPQTAPAVAEALLARLDQMEGALRSLQAQAAADRQALGDLLRELQSGLQALRTEGAHAPVADRSQAIAALFEARLSDLGKSIGALGERFAGLEGLGTLGERLGAIDKLAAANHSWSDAWDELRTHMQAVEGRVGSQTLDVANRIADAFSQRLGQTEAALQLLQEEAERHWSSDGERQIALEASVRAHLQAAEEAAKKQDRDLGEIYQALVKLGANQQTLGDNFTAWRIETGGDIGIVNNGLQKLEQTALDLLSLQNHLEGELQALRQESQSGGGSGRRNRFKRWLFGTGKVFADAPAVRRASAPAEEDVSDAKVEIVEKKS